MNIKAYLSIKSIVKRLRETLLDTKILGRRSRVELLLLLWFFLKRNYYKKKILVYKLSNHSRFIRSTSIFSTNAIALFCFWLSAMNSGYLVLKSLQNQCKIKTSQPRIKWLLNFKWLQDFPNNHHQRTQLTDELSNIHCYNVLLCTMSIYDKWNIQLCTPLIL